MFSILDQINAKSSRTGWGSQMLENLAYSQGSTMAEVFLMRNKGRPVRFIPAICIKAALPNVTYEFKDGSKAEIDAHSIIIA